MQQQIRSQDPESLCGEVEARAMLGGISESTARNWRRDGKLPYVRIGKRVLYKRADLLTVIEKNRVVHPAK